MASCLYMIEVKRFWQRTQSPLGTFILAQFLFSILHFVLGVTQRLSLQGDEVMYVGLAREYAHNFLDSEISSTWAYPLESLFYLQPNFIYPALLGFSQLAHEFFWVQKVQVLQNTIIFFLGALSAFFIFVQQERRVSIRSVILLSVALNLVVYTNFIGFATTEIIHFSTFLGFVALCIYVCQRVVLSARVPILLSAGFGAFIGLAYFVKITFLFAPLIYGAAAICVIGFMRGHWLHLIVHGSIMAVSWVSVLLIVHAAIGVDFLGRYSSDVSYYSSANAFEATLTLLGALLNLSAQTLFLGPAALYLLLRNNWKGWGHAKKFDQAQFIFVIVTLVAILVYPTIMALHATSHLAYFLPEKNWYIFHERVYGFIPFLLVIAVFMARKDIFAIIQRPGFAITALSAVSAWYLLQDRELEAYAGFAAAPTLAVVQAFDIPDIAVFLLPLTILFATFVIARKYLIFESIFLPVLLCYLGFLKAANYIWVWDLHRETIYAPSKVEAHHRLIVDSNYSPIIIPVLMADNRAQVLNFEWSKLEQSTETRHMARTYLPYLPYDKQREDVYGGDPQLLISPGGLMPVAPDALVANVQYMSGFKRNKFLSLASYRFDFKQSVSTPLVTFQSRATPQDQGFPNIERRGIARFLMHPSEDAQALLVMTNVGSKTLTIESHLIAYMAAENIVTNQVKLTLTSGDGETKQYVIDKSNPLEITRPVTLGPKKSLEIGVDCDGDCYGDSLAVEFPELSD